MQFNMSDPVLQSYILHSALLGLKVLFMVVLTGRQRYAKGVFANVEDAKSYRFGKGKVKLDDPDVERVRRAHLNDLENIPVFWILGALYVTTGPPVSMAINLFRAYTVSRIVHTIVYAVRPLPQPSRALAFFVAYGIQCYMGVQVILYYKSAL